MTDNDMIITAWIKLMRAQQTALSSIEAALKSAHLPPLRWYDILWELDRAQGPLSQIMLEGRLLLTQYNLSRLIDRMEKAGLVIRTIDPDDGRSRLISLTDAGRTKRREIWPVYSGAIDTVFGQKLSQDDARHLADLLGKVSNDQKS